MALIPKGLFRIALLSCVFLLLITFSFLCRDSPASLYYAQHHRPHANPKGAKNLHSRLDLTASQCQSVFPHVFTDITRSVARGPFVFKPENPSYKGLVQGRIKNGNLYILSTALDISPLMQQQRTATLSQIHRALTTSPSADAIPDTYFAFTINDVPKNDSWAFAAPNKLNSATNVWLIPPFSSWSWPTTALGTMDEILSRITAVEDSSPWAKKVDKVVWRGTPWFNPLGHPDLRRDLLHVTAERTWADVRVLNATTALRIEEFCRFKYVVYTEGVTYSGRLPYHQACESVLITAPLTWLTTTALLLRPVRAEELMHGTIGSKTVGRSSLEILRMETDWRDANAIYVKPDFSNLEAVIEFLGKHPHIAKRIARNQRATMVDGGYLGEAAETCYWRALIRGWAEVARVNEEDWGAYEGERYETWLLKEVGGAVG